MMDLILSRLFSSQWRLPLRCLTSTSLSGCPPSRNLNNNTASICKIHRTVYERSYPTAVILPDGSSINIQYHEPRKIIKNKQKVTLNNLITPKEKEIFFVGLQKSAKSASTCCVPWSVQPAALIKKCEIGFREKGDSQASRRFSCKTKTMSNYQVVMLRHGESEWNQQNLFCGWYDSNLSDKGIEEADAAGKALKDTNYQFDIAFTSFLTRAQKTLEAILKAIDQTDLPSAKSWRLNERHYGGLTGLNKAETAAKYGEEQVQIWRRSFDVPPPEMERDHKLYDIIVKDARYSGCFNKPCEFPTFESLKMTSQRTLPYWHETIVPEIKAGKRVLIAAHGNSLRGIVKYLDNISDKDIMGLNLPTGIPFVYELDENMKPVVSMKFLGDEETVKKAMESVANQGKAK